MEETFKIGTIDFISGKPASSKIFDSGSCKVMELALEQGGEIKTHTTPVDALLIIVEGTIEFHISGEVFTMKKQDAFKIPATIPHSLAAMENSRMLLIK
jgi:phage shock protein E